MTEITNTIIEFFNELFHNDILTIIFIAIFPIIELRGAIPVAFKLGMPWHAALGYSFIGSSLVVPLLLLLLMPLLNAMKKLKGFRSLAHAVESVFEGKASKIQTKADAAESERKALFKKMFGVFLFVAVPLPLTGVWTGSCVAVFLGLKFWQALPMILLGNLTAGAIMTTLSVCFADYVDLILNVFLIIVVVIVLFYIIMLTVKIVKNKKKGEGSVDAVDGEAMNVVSDDTKSIDSIESESDVESIEATDEASNDVQAEDAVKTSEVVDDSENNKL